MRYLITFTSYGSHLHGDGRGSVDRHHNVPGGRYMDPSMERVAAMREQMDQEPYLLDRARRGIVFRAIREVCFYRKWTLLTVHVRTNHVHAVVDADVDPEQIGRAHV